MNPGTQSQMRFLEGRCTPSPFRPVFLHEKAEVTQGYAVQPRGEVKPSVFAALRSPGRGSCPASNVSFRAET